MPVHGPGFMLAGTSSAARINDLLVGAAVIALSLPRGIRESFGSLDWFVR